MEEYILNRKAISYILAGLLFLVLVSAQTARQTEPSHEEAATVQYDEQAEHADHAAEEGFSPSDFIFDHVLDAYEWHILSYDDFHLSIPLPVIIYSDTKGLNVFMFNKFHHGHEDFKGFRFESHGENKGNIVEILEDGSTALPRLDLSFSKNVLAIMFSLILLLWVFLSVAKAYSRRPDKAPTGMQNLLEPIILFIRDDIAKPSIGEHKYERFMPFLLTVFFFILFNNMIGLIPIFPGGANVTGSISVTMVLALFTFVITTINGNRNYWLHIFNMPGVPWWVKFPIPLMPVIEIIGMMTKPFVLMIRLFANITAGHIIVLGFFSLIFIFGEMSVGLGLGVSVLSLAFTIFMTMLELLVALIQAYVFTLLSAIYFGMATEEHH
ncbi:MAG: F0F1 ATP synthase subunit A [Bacteroidales bacterium]